MWYDQNAAIPDWSKATRYLSKVDPEMKKLIKKVGPCRMAPRKDYFIVLCTSIFNQQISMAAAASLFTKFRAQFPRNTPTPARTLEFLKGDEALIRSCGISRQKRAYLIDLSQHFLDNKIPIRKLDRMTDEEISQALTAVHGIGRWTAEMFLMFVLNRPDVFPIDDLGLQAAVHRVYGLPERPKPKVLLPLGEKWRPWRTIATWYLWRGLEG
jgi:DNA-3-methyladenine glycosylase II